MNIERILEIGVAVDNLDAARSPYTEILQANPGDIIVDTEYYDMRLQMCRVGNVDFELMESLDDRNVIGRFLKKRNPGLHHLAFKVPDIFQAMEWMRKNNIQVITDPPTRMANLLAIFLHPKSFNGVMFELIEGLHYWVEKKDLPAALKGLEQGKSRCLFRGIIEIGVAVTDLEATSGLYRRALRAAVSTIISIDPYEMQMRVCRLGNVNIKLMQSKTIGGVISRFIKKRGQGLHHVTLQVSDLDKAIRRLKERKVEMVRQGPETFNGFRSVFVHPRSFSGVMLELCEGQRDWFAHG